MFSVFLDQHCYSSAHRGPKLAAAPLRTVSRQTLWNIHVSERFYQPECEIISEPIYSHFCVRDNLARGIIKHAYLRMKTITWFFDVYYIVLIVTIDDLASGKSNYFFKSNELATRW